MSFRKDENIQSTIQIDAKKQNIKLSQMLLFLSINRKSEVEKLRMENVEIKGNVKRLTNIINLKEKLSESLKTDLELSRQQFEKMTEKYNVLINKENLLENQIVSLEKEISVLQNKNIKLSKTSKQGNITVYQIEKGIVGSPKLSIKDISKNKIELTRNSPVILNKLKKADQETKAIKEELHKIVSENCKLKKFLLSIISVSAYIKHREIKQ